MAQLQFKLGARWEEENQKNQENQENQKDPKKYHLAADTTLEDLRVLFYSSAEIKKKNQGDTAEVYRGIIHPLFRGIFRSLRRSPRAKKNAELVNGVLL